MRKGCKRLQFDFSKEEIKRLEKIGRWIESRTNAETIRRMLRFYEHLLKYLKRGWTLQLTKGKGTIIISMDLF